MSTPRPLPPVITGDHDYDVHIRCPNCGEDAYIPVHIAARLERTRSEAKLGVKVKVAKVEHQCGQTTINVIAETGEITGQIRIGDE